MSKNITVTLTEKELATAISSLLFSSSINVVSDTGEEFQTELYELAKKLKDLKQDVILENIQFLKEETYEDTLSNKVLEDFKQNLKEIITFEQI